MTRVLFLIQIMYHTKYSPIGVSSPVSPEIHISLLKCLALSKNVEKLDENKYIFLLCFHF